MDPQPPEDRTFPDHETGHVYRRIPADEFPILDDLDSTTVPTHPDDPA